MRDAAWFERQRAHCEAVLEHNERQHTEEERARARLLLDEYARKNRRSAPHQNELQLAA